MYITVNGKRSTPSSHKYRSWTNYDTYDATADFPAIDLAHAAGDAYYSASRNGLSWELETGGFSLEAFGRRGELF